MSLYQYGKSRARKAKDFFTYKKLKKAPKETDVRRLKDTGNAPDEKPLTGYIHNQKSSDLEERFFRACLANGYESSDIQYNVPVDIRGGMKGDLKKVDFFVQTPGLTQPVEIDGEIGHSTAAQIGYDDYRERMLNAVFIQMGISPLIRIKAHQLQSQDQANAVVLEEIG
jgi:hypothetical protein